ncbi:MAG TPA: tetratricopeptide repeat protein [Thermoanaerobaculia bacterium]|jgi:predicted CXXCH cytochrome family protein|nr:tetratricopeptide repeat protein [Thermoanaerobaculia bacterium]
MAAAPGYTGDAACASCHADIARSYQQVGMSRSFSRPRRETLIEDLGKELVHARSKQTFQLVWKEGRLLFRRYERDADGKPVHLLEQPVDWILGSGDHARIYLYQTPEGELYQLPIAWYAQTKSWGMAPGYDRADHDGVSRRVRHECMFCHNAYPDLAESRDGYWRSQAFPKQLPEGIGCQRCHGPGAAHAAAMSAGKSDDTIVNPARLSPQRGNDVCNQCHLLPAVAVQGARRLGRDVYSFRPGQALSDYALPTDITAAGGERFEISHQAYRMEQSRCFRESGDRLSCLSCHDPHRAIAPAERAAHFRKVCLGCHETMSAGGKEHAPGTRADCTSCHMPKRRTQDVVHVVMTDHRIGRYGDVSKLLDPLGESEPEVENVQLYDPAAVSKPAERDLYRLMPLLRTGHTSDPRLVQRFAQAAAAMEEVEPLLDLANVQSSRQQWPSLERTAKTVLWRAPSQPLALAWLGLAQQGEGKQEEAVASLRRAVALAPERAGLHMNLALALIRNGREEEAIKELERATALRPNLAAAWLQLAELRARRKELPAAIEAYERTLAIEPGDKRAALGLSRAMLATGRGE